MGLRGGRDCCLAFLMGIFVLVAAVHAREITVQEAIVQAQQETRGKVLSVQTLHVGKHKIYRIKVITHDGLVRIIEVPAEQ